MRTLAFKNRGLYDCLPGVDGGVAVGVVLLLMLSNLRKLIAKCALYGHHHGLPLTTQRAAHALRTAATAHHHAAAAAARRRRGEPVVCMLPLSVSDGVEPLPSSPHSLESIPFLPHEMRGRNNVVFFGLDDVVLRAVGPLTWAL